jgi:RNA polymerase sigma factor (sigma-70 family)
VLVEKMSESIVLEFETPEAEVEEAEEKLSKRQAFLAVHDKISKLPLKYQEVLSLRFFEEKKVEEISAILGKNKGAVNNLLYRGLAKLQTMLQQDEAPNREKQNSIKEVEYGKVRID